jgi:hypothetical protein
MINPEELFALYKVGGREACIKELCVFPDKNGNLNVTMAKIVDCVIDSIEGNVDEEESAEELNMLSERLRLEVNDIVLDLYNEEDITSDLMVETFAQLRNVGKKG